MLAAKHSQNQSIRDIHLFLNKYLPCFLFFHQLVFLIFEIVLARNLPSKAIVDVDSIFFLSFLGNRDNLVLETELMM